MRRVLWISCLLGLLSAAAAPAASIKIKAPQSEATVSNTVTVAAEASADAKFTSVFFKLDGASAGAPVTASPFEISIDTRDLRNGVHTLLALAKDADGKTTRSEIVPFHTLNPVRFVLGDGPFVVEDLGSILSANTQEKQIMFRLPSNNDLHLLLYYDVVDDWKYPMQLLDVNLSQGSSHLADGVLGRPGPTATVLHPNGKIYLGSGDPGYLLEYDPLSGQAREITKLHPTVRRDAQMAEIGDDGWVYIGEYSPVGGAVARYNPANGVFQDLGVMDAAQKAPQYAYTVGSDGRYVYAGLAQMPWYLAVYDLQAKTTAIHWKTEGDTFGAVCRGKNGGWFYERATSSRNLWYRLENGKPVEIAAASVPPYLKAWRDNGNVLSDRSLFAEVFGTEISLDDAYPDNGANRAIIRWRAVGGSEWRSVTATGFRLEPINLKRVYPWKNNQLFGFADFYGPVFLYDLDAAKTISLGRPQYSLYDGLAEQGRMYLSGYTAATLEYDPSRPWTLNGSTMNQSDSNINPRKIPLGLGKYHYYSAFGADGLVYIGSHHERDSTGGSLGWYDPVEDTSGRLREPFISYDVRDLKSVLGGTKLVYSSSNEKLFVFDVATKQIERSISPIPGVGALDKIVETAPGIVFGATADRIYAVDIRNGSVLYTKTLPSQAFGGTALLAYDHRLNLGPDGFVWMFIGNSIHRINPKDGTLRKILDAPARSLFFSGPDLYLYGGPNLGRVRHALQSASLIAPSGLEVVRMVSE